MFCTLDRAAQLTGLRSSTILEGIECGRITATKDLFGEWQIETGELERLGAAPAESLDEAAAPSPTERNLLNVEAAIAAVIKEAGESLRGESADCPSDTAPPLQPTAEPAVDVRPGPAPEPEIDLGLTKSVRDPAWDPELRIDEQRRIMPAAPRRRGRIAIAAGVIVGTLSIGWIAGFGSALFYRPGSQAVLPGARQNSDARTLVRSAKIAAPVPSMPARRLARTHATAPRSGVMKSPSAPQLVTGSLGAAGSGVQREPETPPRLVPFPETKPTTMEGWVVRDVVGGGTAILAGPTGTWRAAQGDTVPGAGRVESIVRWGDRWIVATSNGLISTP